MREFEDASYSRDVAMLFAPFGCTYPPPPVPPLYTAYAEPKSQGHCWMNMYVRDIMKLKVSLVGKGLSCARNEIHTCTYYTALVVKLC